MLNSVKGKTGKGTIWVWKYTFKSTRHICWCSDSSCLTTRTGGLFARYGASVVPGEDFELAGTTAGDACVLYTEREDFITGRGWDKVAMVFREASQSEQTKGWDYMKGAGQESHLNSSGACSCSPKTQTASRAGLSFFNSPFFVHVCLNLFIPLFSSFHTLHLHITSGAQFWRTKSGDKGRWLITPHWDRDASLLHVNTTE